MFKTEDIIGDVVFISFKSVEQFSELGIQAVSGHFLVRGYDQLGLWLEHPGIIVMKTEDRDGKPIPNDKIKKKEIDANFLATWDNINTIMHYPNREGYDFPSEFDIEVGFKK